MRAGRGGARTAPSVARLGVWLTPGDHEELDRYAKSLHLDAGIVAALLALRFVRRDGALAISAVDLGGAVASRVRLTTSIRDLDGRNAFRRLAKRHGCSPEAALRSLIRTEIRDHWLESALGNQIDSGLRDG